MGTQLRRGAEIKLAAPLKDGAAGVIETGVIQKHGLRKGEQEKTTSNLLRGFNCDESGNARSVAQHLRDALSANAVRVMDVFRECHVSVNGRVSRKEFHAALLLLGFDGMCVASRSGQALAGRSRSYPPSTLPKGRFTHMGDLPPSLYSYDSLIPDSSGVVFVNLHHRPNFPLS